MRTTTLRATKGSTSPILGRGLTIHQPVGQPDRFSFISSPIGELLLTSDGTFLTGLYFEGSDEEEKAGPAAELDDTIFAPVITQLDEYFEGKRKKFDLRLAIAGTPFQHSVWNALKQIPYGSTKSYVEIAREVKRPRAYRAVGSANGANRVAVILPCHRVIAADGSLGGFGGGLERKEQLLDLERGR